MIRRLSVGLVLTVLAACGSAKLIQRTPYGGTIELNGDRGKAQEQANEMMAQHCGPGNWRIEREGEEPVGTDTYSREDTNYGESTSSSRSGRHSNTEGGSTTSGVTSTRTAMAWRIHYACGATAGPAPGGPPPGGPPPGGAGYPPPGGDPNAGGPPPPPGSY